MSRARKRVRERKSKREREREYHDVSPVPNAERRMTSQTNSSLRTRLLLLFLVLLAGHEYVESIKLGPGHTHTYLYTQPHTLAQWPPLPIGSVLSASL